MAGLTSEELRELHQLREILDSGTYYDLFGIGRGFDRAQLRTSYYAISRRFHPDRFYRQDLGGHETLLEEVFAGVNLAYRTLDDPEERKKYDREIGPKAPTPPPGPPPSGASARDRASSPPPVQTARVVDTGDVPDSHTVTFEKPAEGEPSDEQAVEAPKKPRKKRPARNKPTAPPAVAALKRQLIKRLKKARTHYRAGEEAEANAQWVAAASSYYLAHQYDPRNREYETAFQRANGKARTIQVAQLVQLARNAEDYGSHSEAIVYYQKAVELDPPDGEAFFRLGVLLKRLDPEDRAVLDNLRAAVVKTGNRVEYRLALAEVYEATGMKLNAHREYQAAARLEPGNDTAKSGVRRTR